MIYCLLKVDFWLMCSHLWEHMRSLLTVERIHNPKTRHSPSCGRDITSVSQVGPRQHLGVAKFIAIDPPPSSVQERGTRSTSEEFKFSRPSRRQTRSASKEQMQRQSVVNFTFAIVKGKRGLETTNAPRRRKSRRTDFKIKREKMTRSVFHMKGQIGPVAQRHLFCDPNETGKEERWKRRAARNGAVNTEAYPPYKTAFM